LSRRSTILLPSDRDGTSQSGRHLPALDPSHVAIDERTTADLLGFVRELAKQIRFVEADESANELRDAGNWSAFVNHDQLGIADAIAWLADPDRYDGEQARWLGRPHFALLLVFLELLGHARTQLNGLTGRHLDFYYREILHMLPEPAVADRAAVVFKLGSRASEARLAAGTALLAGRDSAGVPRIYRLERELIVNRASVEQVRSVYVDRRITGIADVRKNASSTAAEAFMRTLELALGDPAPGDKLPKFNGQPITIEFLVNLVPLLGFASSQLRLEPHELRTMMKLVRRRAAADPEWTRINVLLGRPQLGASRNFDANFASVVGVLDFENDTLPQVANLDDLFDFRQQPAVRAYIDTELKELGPNPEAAFATFEAIMRLKRRIDGEWSEINRLLERAGRRQRDVLTWSLESKDPSDFAGNLAKALGGSWHAAWPAGLPSLASFANDAQAIAAYEQHVRALERHFSTSAERLASLVAFAEKLGNNSEAHEFEWREIDRILADAHREKIHAARRAALDVIRNNRNNLEGFDAVVAAVLPKEQVANLPSWEQRRSALAEWLDIGQLQLLDHFRLQLTEPWTAQLFDWWDVFSVLELAQRYVERMPEPVARKIEWHNLYAYEDAKAVLDASNSSRWKTFGRRPPRSEQSKPPTTALGWAVRSPLLALSQGTRTITLTFGLRKQSFDRASFLRALGLELADENPTVLRDAVANALRIEVSTDKGWIDLQLPAVVQGFQPVELRNGGIGNDYWTATGLIRPENDEDRPALQLRLRVDATVPAIGPTLRLLLRQRWNEEQKEWTTAYTPFATLQLVATHVRVDVAGLVDLELQQDDRKLDPRKPFAPFGTQPAVGARLYLSHPELVRARLDDLRFELAWMGLPNSLETHYANYPGITDSSSFKTRVSLVDRDLPIKLLDVGLFTKKDNATASGHTIQIAKVPEALSKSISSFAYVRRDELLPSADLRAASRYFSFELTPVDFGHSTYPGLAARKAQDLAAWLSNKIQNQAGTTDPYRVEVPYTPMLQRLTVGYSTSTELLPGVESADRLLHIHPFGVSTLDSDAPSLVPRYDSAGELYIGVRAAPAPGKLALLLQLAEGTSNPDLEPAAVEWSYLDEDRFQPLDLQFDSTRGLLNSGVVELNLPVARSGSRLPAELFWLRVSVPRSPQSVCDCVDIRAQAGMALFDDRQNAPDHYARPLPAGSIDRLQAPDPRIVAVEQPYTSSGGKLAEQASWFHTRISERLRHKQRALTAWDYERLVLRFSEIYKVKCLPAGEPGEIDIVVIPNIRDKLPADAFAPRAPANLLADIQAYLCERAPASARVRVRNARFVPVLVRLGVRFAAGQDAHFAKRRLNDELNRFLSPWAYEEGAELMIGQKIFATSIIDFVDRREYVDYVTDIKLFRGRGEDAFDLVHRPSDGDYYVATDYPDQVLVAARQHTIDVISELGYQQTSFTGINYMKIELDFIVG
jgi:hypothetical protein